MKREFITESKVQTQQLAMDFIANLKNTNVVLLFGNLGAGKTTFCQGVLRSLNAEGPFVSPTFVIIKEYILTQERQEIKNRKTSSQFKKVYHWDCYRIGTKDALALGWEEIVANPENLVLVEWPEKIKKIWPKNFIKIAFESNGKKRKIIFEDKN